MVGAGAAGLMAAIRSADGGARTLLLEKNRRPGVKILMSGGTRCNITHNTDNRGIVEAFGQNGRFLHSALAAFSVQDTIDFFERAGVVTKVEDAGKIFPASNKASDVLDALVRRLAESGAALALGEPVLDISSADGFRLTTPLRVVDASHAIITTGGRSYPGSGTTGDGYEFARRFGHRIVPPRPALTPIRVAASWVAALRGLTIPDVALRVRAEDKVLAQRRGSLLFAHFGLSGPVALDVSGVISAQDKPSALILDIDLLPALSRSELDERLRTESASQGKKLLAAVLGMHLPRRLADALLEQAGLPADRRAASLSKTDRVNLVDRIKCLRLEVAGTLGFEKAEVTAGGVALDEVHSSSLESKKQPGLFLAGEVLDLDGPIGGYNFQAAWSTGWLAGAAASASR